MTKGIPAELALAQMRDNRVTPGKKTDVSDKKINPWVYSKVYDAVNPMAYSRDNL